MRVLTKYALILCLLSANLMMSFAQIDTVHYFCDESYSPYEYKDHEGNAGGFNVDILKSIADKMGFVLDVQPLPWIEAIQKFHQSKENVVLAMFKDEDRDSLGKFSLSFIQVKHTILFKQDKDYNSLEDLKGKTIAVQENDIMHHWAATNLNARIITTKNPKDAILCLEKGECDAALAPQLLASYIIENSDFKNIHELPIKEGVTDYSFLVKNDDVVLLTLINSGLNVLDLSGDYQKIYNKWFGLNISFAQHFRRYGKWVLLTLIIIAALIIVMIWTLRRQVFKKTKELQLELLVRKEMEEKLKIAIQKAEESDRLKSAFLANMSHEIRTPLNGILGFTELLKKQNLEEDKKNKFVGIIEKSGHQLLNLINDIIEISKIEAQQIKIIKKDFSLNKCLDELMDSQFISRKTNANIEFRLKKYFTDEDSFIHNDEHRIRQIYINLINNAIKFTSTGYIEIGYERNPGDELLCYVKDTGRGVPDEKKEYIFERFMQAESEDELSSGAGLGLSICVGILKELKGNIWVEDNPGGGSVFKFSIPYVKAKSEILIQNEEYIGIYDWSKYSILIAEDELSNFLYLEEILRDTEIQVIWAKNGREVLEKYNSNKNISILLMDIKMPDIDGIEAAREIRKISPNVPIIAQTAFAMREDKKECLEAGCNAYVSKPINQAELKQVISRFLDK